MSNDGRAASADDLDALRHKVATACRILAAQGLAEDILGHVSVRVGTNHALVRCRGPHERGLAFTTAADVHLVGLDGTADLPDLYAVPNELPIHLETLRARPDVQSVVHAHPPAVIAVDLAGVPFVPLFGAYNIPAAKIAEAGVPVYPRGVLIRTPELASEMLAAMGQSSVCVLRGHGVTVAGRTIERAVTSALALNSLARMVERVTALGGTIQPLPDADLALLPDLGTDFNDIVLWRHHESQLDPLEPYAG